MKKKVKRKKEKVNYQKIILDSFMLGVTLGLAIAFIYFSKLLFEVFLDNLKSIFSNEILANIILHIIIFIMAFAVFITWRFFQAKRKGNNIKWWMISTIWAMIFLIWIGTAFITMTVGIPNLDSVLRDMDENNEVIGEITCDTASGEYIINDLITCDIEPKLNNMNVEILFIYDNNTQEELHMKDRISFNGPEDLKRISFLINGNDTDNNYRTLSVGRDFKFVSIDESIERRDGIILYFIVLLGVVFFSVPTMMLDFKKLFK